MNRAALSVLFALGAGACRPPELVVRVDTDLQPGVDFDQVTVTLQRDDGGVRTALDLAFNPVMGPRIPLEFGVTPFDSADVPLNVVATAFLAGNPVVAQSASAHFDSHTVHPINLLLLRSCTGIDALCAASGASATACAWGQCVAPSAVPYLVDATTTVADMPPALPTYPGCPPGFASCSTSAGCESDLRLAAHCGACGHACSTPGVGCSAPLCDDERATAIAAGGFLSAPLTPPGAGHACAIVSNSASAPRVMCWGSNDAGELGADPPVQGPVIVPALPGTVTMITAGGQHSCALVEMSATVRSVFCWGNNRDSELGANSTAMSSAQPLAVVGPLNGVTMVAAGAQFTCALGSGAAAAVMCWGRNDRHQSAPTALTTPVVATATQVTTMGGGLVSAQAGSLCVGRDFACVVKANTAGQNVQCWGNTTHSSVATSGGFTTAMLRAPALGLACGSDFTCALERDTAGAHHVECFGLDSVGQTGTTMPATTPTTVTGVEALDPDVLVANGEHACASNSTTGAVRCWGDRSFGQLGVPDDGTGPAFSPVPPTHLMDIGALAAGAGFTCGIRASTGQIMCWGDNSTHELGASSVSTNSPVPVFVAPPLGGL